MIAYSLSAVSFQRRCNFRLNIERFARRLLLIISYGTRF